MLELINKNRQEFCERLDFLVLMYSHKTIKNNYTGKLKAHEHNCLPSANIKKSHGTVVFILTVRTSSADKNHLAFCFVLPYLSRVSKDSKIITYISEDVASCVFPIVEDTQNCLQAIRGSIL